MKREKVQKIIEKGGICEKKKKKKKKRKRGTLKIIGEGTLGYIVREDLLD